MENQIIDPAITQVNGEPEIDWCYIMICLFTVQSSAYQSLCVGSPEITEFEIKGSNGQAHLAPVARVN